MYGKSLTLALCALAAACPLLAQSPPKFDAAAVERGKAFFVSTCGFCHGPNAKGGEKGPDLLRSVLVLDDEGGKSLGPFLAKGRPNKGMPSFTLTPQQVKDIAEFLHSSVAAAADRDKYKVLNIVTGNAQAGKTYFDAHCASCHSATGDLKGIGKRYEPVTLQDRFVMPRPEEGSEAQMYKLIVTLPDGQKFEGVPVTFDDFTVALRDAHGDYHSFRRSSPESPKVELKNKLQAHYDLLPRYSDSDIHNLTAYLVTLK